MNRSPGLTNRPVGGGVPLLVIVALGLAVLLIVGGGPGTPSDGLSSEGGVPSTRGNPALSASATSTPVPDPPAYPASGRVSFHGNATGGVPPYAYYWDFGDGASSSDPNPVHVYAVPGAFISTLTVTDLLGAVTTSTLASIVDLDNPPPYVIFATPPLGPSPLDVGFQAYGAPPETTKYRWDFDDGNLSTAEHPTHEYVRPGTYLTRLDLIDPVGVPYTYRITVIALGSEPLKALASYPIERTGTCFPVTFRVEFQSAAGGGTPPYHYFWDFGDSGTSQDPQPTHIYRAGFQDFHVQVRVMDIEGSVATSSVVFTTYPPPCPTPGGDGLVGGTGGVTALGVAGVATIALAAVFTLLLRKRFARAR